MLLSNRADNWSLIDHLPPPISSCSTLFFFTSKMQKPAHVCVLLLAMRVTVIQGVLVGV